MRCEAPGMMSCLLLTPNCNGFEVVEALEQNNPVIKKVLMTGSHELLRETEKVGADKILLKPIALGQLLQTVNRLVDL